MEGKDKHEPIVEWEYPKDEENASILIKLPHFGMKAHSLKEAANLVALDMYYSGEFKSSGIIHDDIKFEYSRDNDPRIVNLISKEIDKIEKKLVTSVESGRIKAAYVSRNFDEVIVSHDTYVRHIDLREWLECHGYTPGDILLEWWSKDAEMVSYIVDEIVYLKKARREGGRLLQDIMCRKARRLGYGILDKDNDLYASWKRAHDRISTMKIKYERLRIKYLSAHKFTSDLPLNTTKKRTHHAIIAALCNMCGIDWEKRGAAKQIMEATERIGVTVTDDTIKKILTELPDSLESRMK